MALLNGIIAGFALFLLAFPQTSDAAGELRCQELGAKCACSTTMNSTPWTDLGSGWWYPNEPDPQTNTPGYCASTVVSGHSVNFFTWPVTATAETLMPAGNTVTNVVRLLNPNGAMIAGKGSFPGLTGRVCVRMYVKLDANFQSTGDGACENDKYMALNDEYIAGFGGAVDLFSSSMGGFMTAPPHIKVSDCKNKWCRIEMCSNNMQSGGTRQIEIHYRNITDNGPVRSSTQNCNFGCGVIESAYIIHGYRQGTCNGFREFSHGMIAVWPNAVGNETIGAAYEIEGGVGDVNPPSPPSSLRLSWLWGKWSHVAFWRLPAPAHSASFASMASILPESTCRTSAASRFLQERIVSTR